MIDRSQVQVKIEWVKVTHLNRVKRISKPSSELPVFIEQIKVHFKELADMSYLYNADGSKNEAPGSPGRNKSKFVLHWHSQSPNEESRLDISMNAVEVSSQEQFFEILCTHAIVDRNNQRVSVPRFTAYVIEAEAQIQLAGVEVSLNEQELLADL